MFVFFQCITHAIHELEMGASSGFSLISSAETAFVFIISNADFFFIFGASSETFFFEELHFAR